jgi:hypothetical protein
MMNYVIYGHTDYLDILNIQTDYLQNQSNVTLFLNYNTLDLDNLYLKYDKVIFYDDTKPYASRLSMAIDQLDCKYFLFMHDIDILLNADNSILESFLPLMDEKSIDRIDLKHTGDIDGMEILDFGLKGSCMVKQTNPGNYIYNVNPSIWKKESFIEILNTFPDKTYRNIEDRDVQNFSSKFNVYKLHSEYYKLCGYFNCLDFFIFLHISHSGKLLPLTEDFQTVYGQSYEDASFEYTNIVNKYNLRLSKKWIQ